MGMPRWRDFNFIEVGQIRFDDLDNRHFARWRNFDKAKLVKYDGKAIVFAFVPLMFILIIITFYI